MVESTGLNVVAMRSKLLFLFCVLLVSLDAARSKNIQGLVKNGIDIIIPSARLGWLPVSDGNTKTARMAPTVSSHACLNVV